MVRRTLCVAFASDREGAGGSIISGHDRGRTFRCPNWSVMLLYFVVICLLGLVEAGCVAEVRCARLGIHIIHIYRPVRNDGEHSLGVRRRVSIRGK